MCAAFLWGPFWWLVPLFAMVMCLACFIMVFRPGVPGRGGMRQGARRGERGEQAARDAR